MDFPDFPDILLYPWLALNSLTYPGFQVFQKISCNPENYIQFIISVNIILFALGTQLQMKSNTRKNMNNITLCTKIK